MTVGNDRHGVPPGAQRQAQPDERVDIAMGAESDQQRVHVPVLGKCFGAWNASGVSWRGAPRRESPGELGYGHGLASAVRGVSRKGARCLTRKANG